MVVAMLLIAAALSPLCFLYAAPRRVPHRVRAEVVRPRRRQD
ncbi:MAG: hypothetical protein U1E20_05805 [Methylocystis sp.]